MTPARHNIMHFARQHGLSIEVQCFANGTMAQLGERAWMLPNSAGYDDVCAVLGPALGVKQSVKQSVQREVRREHRPSAETMERFSRAVDTGVEVVEPDVVVFELSLSNGLDLHLHPDGSVRWRRHDR